MTEDDAVIQAEDLPAEPFDRDRWMAAGLGLASIVLAGTFGFIAFLSVPLLVPISLAPFAGLVAALSCRRIVDSVTVAPLGLFSAAFVASFSSTVPWEQPSVWISSLMPAFTIAAVAAGLFSFVLGRSQRLRPIFTFAALALIVLNMWLLGTVGPSEFRVTDRLTTVQWLVEPVKITNEMSDLEVHLTYVQRLAKGDGYYTAVAETLAEKNSAGPYRVDVTNPLSFRSPLVFWLLSQAENASQILSLVLLVGTLAVVAAFVLARLFVADSLALAAAMAVAALTGRLATNSAFLFTETWAGAFGVVCIAALLLSKRRREGGTGPWHLVAIGAALIAALTRELAVAFVLVGFAVTLFDPEWRQRRAWIGWLAALGVLGGALAIHFSLANAAIAELPRTALTKGVAGVWFSPTWRGVEAVIAITAEVLRWKLAALVPFFALACAGAFVGPRDRTSRFALALVVLGGLVAVFFLRPPVVTKELAAGYWGFVFLPTLLAAVPLSLGFLAEWRQPEASAEDLPAQELAPAPTATVEPEMITEAASAEEAEPTRDELMRDLTAAGVGLVGILIGGILGQHAFLTVPDLTVVTLAPFAGLVSALACRKVWHASVVAALGAAGSIVGASLVSVAQWSSPLTWLPSLVPLSLAAAGIGALVSYVVLRNDDLRRIITIGSLALVIMTGWLLGMVDARDELLNNGHSMAVWVVEPQTIRNDMTDPDLYLYYIQRIAAGDGYYEMVTETLAKKNSLGKYQVPVGSPLSIRPPTVYWLLGQFDNPAGIITVMLLLGTLATIATYALVGSFMQTPLALGSAMGIATFFARCASTKSVMWSEAWAGGIGLIAIAALVVAKQRGDKGFSGLHISAILAALVAGLSRELGVAFLLLGLAASLVDTDWRRNKLWVGWAAGLAVFVAAMAVHFSLGSQAIAHLPAGAFDKSHLATASTWLNPDWRGIKSAVGVASEVIVWKMAAVWPLLLLASIGALVAPRDRTSRLVLGGTVIGGIIAVFLVRPGGETSNGELAGYWGFVMIPTLLAATPLCLAYFDAWRKPETPTDLPAEEPLAA